MNTPPNGLANGPLQPSTAIVNASPAGHVRAPARPAVGDSNPRRPCREIALAVDPDLAIVVDGGLEVQRGAVERDVPSIDSGTSIVVRHHAQHVPRERTSPRLSQTSHDESSKSARRHGLPLHLGVPALVGLARDEADCPAPRRLHAVALRGLVEIQVDPSHASLPSAKSALSRQQSTRAPPTRRPGWAAPGRQSRRAAPPRPPARRRAPDTRGARTRRSRSPPRPEW